MRSIMSPSILSFVARAKFSNEFAWARERTCSSAFPSATTASNRSWSAGVKSVPKRSLRIATISWRGTGGQAVLARGRDQGPQGRERVLQELAGDEGGARQ